MTALVGLLGIVVGVLLGGGVQLIVTWRERKNALRRAARLLYGDYWLALSAVRSVAEVGVWWNDKSAPPLEHWRRYREPLADSNGRACLQTVDGGFHRVADLDRWRQAGLTPGDVEDEVKETTEQLYEVGGCCSWRGSPRTKARQGR